MTRHEAREQAFAVIFEKSFNETATFQEIIENAEECGLVKVNGFASTLLKAVEKDVTAPIYMVNEPTEIIPIIDFSNK